ncbi:two-partner secretion domain-containing protein [Scytonema sp. HK-05]|uniref:two-partner secretion domain-containing protein n=1 Tax=Scytonema sp. HK-05 TaxID=1137095 RepID=UPI0009369112|nr:filamentous hemagglutinin N-terminal domain-containing protein [Scytonema sp. HK-05]OKH59303.1 hypothetical protein NIES2130_09410 [Scytonema sp. HK-05]
MSTCGAWFIPIATVFWCNCASAQITPDATLPNNSIININGKTFNITGGTTAGTNLFHSFQQFSVPTGGEAFFNNTLGIQNIISRVTGGSISNIDGLIRTLGKANLFLINPNGIVFGPNARLNIGGSFFASTANSINFADGTKFSATPSQDLPLLTITAPIGLNMGSNPGPILVKGPGHDINYENIVKTGPRPPINTSVTGLQVKEGQTLALVGANVSLEGGVLKSPSGRIEIGSVSSNGVVSLVPVPEGWKLGYEGITSFGDIQFSQKTFVNATGVGGGSIAVAGNNINFTEQSILLADTLGDRNGGEISIVGENIGINQSNISSNTFSSGNAGQIKLDANNITFDNNSSASIQTLGKGDAGNINILANSFQLLEKSALNSNTEENSTGNAGDININVAGSMVSKSAGITTDTSGTGNAGKINIYANSFQMENLGVFSRVVNTGKPGEINVNVADSFVIKSSNINTDTYGTGDAGKINITANSFKLEESGIKSSTTQNSTGNAGEINIQVAGSLEIPKDVGIITTTSGTGDAGKINIYANSFQLENSGLKSSTEGNSTGNAGEINIQVANSFVINSAGISTNTSGTGDAGKINIQVAGPMVINRAGISTNTSGTGDAGQITVTAESLKINPGEIVATSNGSGNAGNLSVRTKTLVIDNVIGNQAGLRVESTGDGNAGTLEIVADTIQLDNQSRIDATTTSGNGGDLRLDVANLLLVRRGSQISATAGTDQKGGNGGNITINAPEGFIVAVPNENSDITANAFNGTGGKININSLGIFNFTQRSREDLVRELKTDNPSELNTQKLSTNDITAFSLTNPTLSGQVSINTPDVDPSKGLLELPIVLTDTLGLIADTGCAGVASTDSDTQKSNFTITGRGGLPPSPYEPLSTDVVWSDNRIQNIASQQRSEKPSTKPPTAYDAVKIVPATGWVFDGKGHVTLISHASNANLGSTPACQKK